MPLFEAIQNLQLFTEIRESALAYPIILSTHLSSIALFGGAILITDLRLLGLAMRGQLASDVIAQLRNWKRIGFVMMVSTGILLAGAKAASYYANPYFQLKLSLLCLVGMHALVFRRRVYGGTAQLDAAAPMPRIAKLAACLSLALWLGILSAGRLIAYYEPAGGAGKVAPGLAPLNAADRRPFREWRARRGTAPWSRGPESSNPAIPRPPSCPGLLPPPG
jgi:hypothetical protein